MKRHGHTSSRNGHFVSRTWKSWDSMKQRCSNPNAPNYPRYGGRGIRVCQRWQQFVNFLSDMGERPLKTTLGRRNNDGHYTRRNCEWQTGKQQAVNRDTTNLGRHPNSLANLTHCGTRESALKAWVTRRANAMGH